MTYCLGIVTSSGIVMAADSRTNAGVDYISTHQKLFDFSQVGDRVILICTAGNLSITQATLTLLRQDLTAKAEHNLHTLPTLYEIARYIGSKAREIQEQDRPWLEKDHIEAKCSFLLGGQIRGEEPALYLIYSQGNCIQASKDTPFLQIGEAKYGKPILDRILSFDTPLEAAAKCALLSIDSTMKSNISVGPPIRLAMYERDTFKIRYELKLKPGTPYLAQIRRLWEISLKEAFDRMPDINWDHHLDLPDEGSTDES
ncbi:MAG: proteasome-type protease [Leptolyngbyaceae cyanobacterium]|jgi:putative proteasome-type protease|uniref:proteasome-type protease n=1 Tax=Leptodesmis sichuanensis TaxID=2906798 RepID=UPI001F203F78|nr:proteasome-type protease [Leptodesmis sichuanensis]UIE39556.1 proteasome-type protease [Leptodesmis sichuanensis A121]